jgi:hypothetical protein
MYKCDFIKTQLEKGSGQGFERTCGKPSTEFYLVWKLDEVSYRLTRCYEHRIRCHDSNYRIPGVGMILNGYVYSDISEDEFTTYEIVNS